MVFVWGVVDYVCGLDVLVVGLVGDVVDVYCVVFVFVYG